MNEIQIPTVHIYMFFFFFQALQIQVQVLFSKSSLHTVSPIGGAMAFVYTRHFVEVWLLCLSIMYISPTARYGLKVVWSLCRSVIWEEACLLCLLVTIEEGVAYVYQSLMTKVCLIC